MTQDEKPEESPPAPSRGESSTRTKRTTALFDFDGESKDELSFVQGDEILMLKQLEQGWTDGMNLRTRKRGIFPTSYVEDG